MSRRRIRLLLVTGDFQVGGTQRHLLSLVRGLERTRFDLSVACLSTDGPLYEVVRNEDVPIECFPIRHRLLHPRSIASVVGLSRRIRERFDLVHTLLGHANVVGLLACSLAGHSAVLSSQRNLHPVYRSLRSGSPWLAAFADLLFRRVARRVIANNQTIVDSLRLRGIPPAKIVLIPNGIDPERFRPSNDRDAAREEAGLPPGATLIGFVGRMIPDKGLGRLLDALGSLAPLPSDVGLVAIGDGPDRAQYEIRAAKLGFPAGSRFTGLRDDVERWFPLLDILAFPSTYSEGTPNVVLESMACAVPPVVHRMVQTESLVEDGHTGLLVDATDPTALARALAGLVNDPARRHSLGAAAREVVRRQYSLDAMLGAVQAVYEEVLTRP